MRHADLIYFINERNAIWERRMRGDAPPWTKDDILHTYRFCNVYRERDPVTEYIHDWLKCAGGIDELTFRAALARYINNPETLTAIGHCHQWNPGDVTRILKERRDAGYRIFNPAYIVSTNGIAMDKIDYVVGLVSRVRKNLDIDPSCSLDMAAEGLMSVRGVGSFMAGQMVADLKFTPLLYAAADWWEWATPGPGSKRGLNKALGLPEKRNWRSQEFLEEILLLHHKIHPHLELPTRLDMQNFQNCLCEFDKWCRVRDGTGTPKQLYTPTVQKIGH
jgi:hypothetical protein